MPLQSLPTPITRAETRADDDATDDVSIDATDEVSECCDRIDRNLADFQERLDYDLRHESNRAPRRSR